MGDNSLDNEEMLGTTDSFEETYRAHSGAIYRYLFWRTRDAQVSEDLTSATFTKAWVARKRFAGSSAQAWLYQIAHNVLIDHWRKVKEVPVEDTESLSDDSTVSTAELLDKQGEITRLQKALGKLPREMRAVIVARFIENMSCKQTAVKLHMSEGNVRVIQFRALKKLKGYLDE